MQYSSLQREEKEEKGVIGGSNRIDSISNMVQKKKTENVLNWFIHFI